jgi:hypothetical protein
MTQMTQITQMKGPPMPVTVTHDPVNGLTATTGAINWPAILKALLAALVAALAG